MQLFLSNLCKGDGWKAAFFDEEANEVYEGELSESSMRDGYGLCVYCSSGNNMFEGEWHGGRESGRGTLMSAQRDVIYDGEWVDGRLNGHGTYYFSSGGE